MGGVVGVCPCLGQYLIKFWESLVKMIGDCMAGVLWLEEIVSRPCILHVGPCSAHTHVCMQLGLWVCVGSGLGKFLSN